MTRRSPAPPAAGKYVLALLEPSFDKPSSYDIADESMLFMPNKSTLSILNGLSNPQIAETLAKARKVRYATDLAVIEPRKPEDTSYWGTHFLLYGRIRGVGTMPKDDKQMGMMFYPMMTLSGNFDTGLSHRMILTGDAKLLERAEKGNALVLGVREKDAFAIPNERPAFMPGNHEPICPLKDLTDPKFSETLKAVQASRKKETPPAEAKPSPPPPK